MRATVVAAPVPLSGQGDPVVIQHRCGFVGRPSAAATPRQPTLSGSRGINLRPVTQDGERLM